MLTTRRDNIKRFARQIENKTLSPNSEDIDLFDGVNTPVAIYLENLQVRKLKLYLEDIDVMLKYYHPNINYLLLGIAKLGDLALIENALKAYGGNLAYVFRGLAMCHPALVDIFLKNFFSPADPIPDSVLREIIIGTAYRRNKAELDRWFRIANVKQDLQFQQWMCNAALEGAGIVGEESFIYFLQNRGGSLQYAVRGLALGENNEELLGSLLSSDFKVYHPYALQGAAMGNARDKICYLLPTRQSDITPVLFGAGLGGHIKLFQTVAPLTHLHKYAVLGAMIGGHFPMVNVIFNQANQTTLPDLYRFAAKGALEYGLENKKIFNQLIHAMDRAHRVPMIKEINNNLPPKYKLSQSHLFKPQKTRQPYAPTSCSVILCQMLCFIAARVASLMMILAFPLVGCLKQTPHNVRRGPR